MRKIGILVVTTQVANPTDALVDNVQVKML